MITIISALKGELEPFINRFVLREKNTIAQGSVYIVNDRFHFLRLGVGKESCRSTLFAYLKIYHPKLLINIGTAGAINPKIDEGSVFNIEKIYTVRKDTPLILDSINELKPGVLLTIDKPLLDASLRKDFFEEYKADLVDMEAYYCSEIALQHHIEFISWKIATDSADENTITDFKKNFKRLTNKLAHKVIPLLLENKLVSYY